MFKKNRKLKLLLSLLFPFIFIVAFFFRKNVTDFFVSKTQYFTFFMAGNLNVSEKEELEAIKVQIKVLQDEILRLRDQLNLTTGETNKKLVELLISDNLVYGDFYVTLPKDVTVYLGMNVYSEGNILVGTVEQILNSSMKVSNLGQNKGVIATSLNTDEFLEIRSLGRGLYYGSVPGGSKIQVGDEIVLKGNPVAIIGTVVEIETTENSQARVYVRTPYNIQNKDFYYVLQ